MRYEINRHLDDLQQFIDRSRDFYELEESEIKPEADDAEKIINAIKDLLANIEQMSMSIKEFAEKIEELTE